MNKKTLPILRWTLFALEVLIAFLIQTVVLGNRSFFGASLSLVPVAAVCVALMTGAEAGGIFCVTVGILYAFTGADMGVITLMSMTVTGILAGGSCQIFFRRHPVPAALFSLMALLLSDGLIYLLKLYFASSANVRPGSVLAAMGLSLCTVLIFYPVSLAISRIGGDAL